MTQPMLKSVSLFLGMLVFAGCGRPPSEDDGRKVVEAEIQSQSHGIIQLVAFEKTNGAMREFMGQKNYTMDCEYEIAFSHDCIWDGRALAIVGKRGGRFSAERCDDGWKKADIEAGLPDQIAQAQGYAKAGFKGKDLGFKATITFQKTEKGWVGSMD